MKKLFIWGSALTLLFVLLVSVLGFFIVERSLTVQEATFLVSEDAADLRQFCQVKCRALGWGWNSCDGKFMIVSSYEDLERVSKPVLFTFVRVNGAWRLQSRVFNGKTYASTRQIVRQDLEEMRNLYMKKQAQESMDSIKDAAKSFGKLLESIVK